MLFTNFFSFHFPIGIFGQRTPEAKILMLDHLEAMSPLKHFKHLKTLKAFLKIRDRIQNIVNYIAIEDHPRPLYFYHFQAMLKW